MKKNDEKVSLTLCNQKHRKSALSVFILFRAKQREVLLARAKTIRNQEKQLIDKIQNFEEHVKQFYQKKDEFRVPFFLFAYIFTEKIEWELMWTLEDSDGT